MKNAFHNLFLALRGANASTRFVLVLALMLIVGVAGFGWYRSANPQMIFFRGDLDSSEFSKVTTALGTQGIRFETTSGRPPYTIWVESSRKHEAWNAIALDGALAPGTRGIDTSGGTSAFDAAIERNQRADARHWQEVEKQLEALSWVTSASVKASMPRTTTIGRRSLPTVSAIVVTQGALRPTITQAKAALRIVGNAFGVPDENVVMTDQEGTPLWSPEGDEGLAGLLEFQRAFDEKETRRAQDWLDATYGPGIARVSVKGEWIHERIESLDESVDPKSKAVLSEGTEESVEPLPAPVGGPAGVQANVQASNQAPVATAEATHADSQKTYTYGTKTTHRVQLEPRLTRLAVSLVLDDSLEPKEAAVVAAVKGLVGFDESRNDLFTSGVHRIFGIERDEAGLPVVPEPLLVPEAPSKTLDMLVEWGLEMLAGLAFVFVLLRSLKGGSKKTGGKDDLDASGLSEALATLQGISVNTAAEDAARRHVEELLAADPERVGALLSRWALGEDYYQQKVKA